MRVVLLVVVLVLAWAVALPVADATLGPGNLLPSVVALGLCLVPATATLLLVELVARRSPDGAVIAIMAGAGVRLFSAAVGVLLLGEVVARYGVGRERFAWWVTALYLVALAAECVLLARAVAGPRSAEAP